MPAGGYDNGTEYEFGAQGYSPDGSTMSYDWKVYDDNGHLTAEYTGSDCPAHGAQVGRTA